MSVLLVNFWSFCWRWQPFGHGRNNMALERGSDKSTLTVAEKPGSGIGGGSSPSLGQFCSVTLKSKLSQNAVLSALQ